MAFMFHLTFFSSETNVVATKCKVVWNGTNGNPLALAPNGMADTNIFARDYDVLLEITQKNWSYGNGHTSLHLV